MNPDTTRPLRQKIDKGSASSARPALVFIHGAGHSTQCWDEHFLDYFADRGYRAIAPGHAREGGRGASIADRVNRVHALVADLPSAPILIGHATGGTSSRNTYAHTALRRRCCSAPPHRPLTCRR